MPTLLDFRRRIRSVKNTQQITRAMKFVSAAMLRRAQEAALAARPYARELARMLRSIMSRIPSHSTRCWPGAPRADSRARADGRARAGRRVQRDILRKAQDFFRANKGKKISTIPVGRKGRDALKKAGFNIIAEYVNVLARVDFGTAREIATLVRELYAKEEIDSVYIVFNEFKTVMTSNLVVENFSRSKHFMQKKSRLRSAPTLKSTTFTSSLRNNFSTNCCLGTSRHSCFARCWNLPRRSTQRA